MLHCFGTLHTAREGPSVLGRDGCECATAAWAQGTPGGASWRSRVTGVCALLDTEVRATAWSRRTGRGRGRTWSSPGST
eukprot:5665304-Prymnesium_polylepis.1